MGMLASASFASPSDVLVDSTMASIKKNYAEYMDNKYWYCEYYKYTGAALAADVVVDEWYLKKKKPRKKNPEILKF
jgi:hypothetical protein